MVSQDGEHVGYKYQMRKSQVGLRVTAQVNARVNVQVNKWSEQYIRPYSMENIALKVNN